MAVLVFFDDDDESLKKSDTSHIRNVCGKTNKMKRYYRDIELHSQKNCTMTCFEEKLLLIVFPALFFIFSVF